MKSVLKNLGTFFASLLVTFLIFEVCVRLYQSVKTDYDIEMWKYRNNLAKVVTDERGHIQKPNFSGRLMGVEVKTNSVGIRDKEYPRKRNPQKKRIAVIGDSFTFGWGVKESSRFSEILEENLKDSSPAEVINFGHVNYNIRQEAELIKSTVTQYKPDLYLLAYYINDADPTQKYQGGILESVFASPIFLMSRVRRILSVYNKSDHYEDYYSKMYKDQSWDEFTKQLLDIQKVTENKLAVVILPELRSSRSDFALETYQRVQRFLERNGVSVLNLQNSLARNNREVYWVAPDDPHPNEEANKIFAFSILNFLNKKEVLK